MFLGEEIRTRAHVRLADQIGAALPGQAVMEERADRLRRRLPEQRGIEIVVTGRGIARLEIGALTGHDGHPRTASGCGP